jgi:hypothetical protein
MGAMAPSSVPAPRGFSRRALLVASAGVALTAAGCTSDSPAGPVVSTEQADQLAGQVAVQERLVEAYTAAAAADPALGAAVAVQAGQASEQFARLRQAAPSTRSSSASPSTAAGPPAGTDVRAWLREHVAVAAGAHAGAVADQTGARAALLGSIAAGLRGHEAVLA